MVDLEFQLIKTRILVLKQLSQGNIKVISHTGHVRAEYILDELVGVTQSCTDRLVDK